MLNVLRNNDATREIVHQGVRLLLVRRTENVNDLKDHDGVIIDTVVETEAEAIVQKIRRLNDKESLIPLFINGIHGFSKELTSHTDGCVDLNNLENICHTTVAINKRLAQINIKPITDFQVQVQYKMVALLYSRNKVFFPFNSRTSRIGYHFPLLSLYFNDDAKNLLKTLDGLETKGLVAKTFKDNVHLCKSCDSTYLNFKEICPSCKSADIRARDMIHHFVCAHVAPEDDFKTENGELCCPKCDKHLRHIGIDYDKPSSIFSCNSCDNEFQNPEMKATCFDCGTDNTLAELLNKVIGEYSITAQGEQWLFDENTLSRKQNETTTTESELSLPVFKLLLKQEIKRVSTNDIQSLYGTITFSKPQLALLNEEFKKALQSEISQIIKTYLAESDLLCIAAYNTYHFLLTDTAPGNITRLENIRYNLSKLLNDNLDNEQSPVKVDHRSLQASDTLNLLFNEVI